MPGTYNLTGNPSVIETGATAKVKVSNTGSTVVRISSTSGRNWLVQTGETTPLIITSGNSLSANALGSSGTVSVAQVTDADPATTTPITSQGGTIYGDLTVTGTLTSSGGGAVVSQVFNVINYGAKMDTKRKSGASAASSTATTVTVAGAGFTSADVGKLFCAFTPYAWGSIRTISAVNSSTQVTLSGQVDVGIGGGTGDVAVWGTNDTAAVQACVNAAGAASTGKLLDGEVNLPVAAGHPVAYFPNVNTGGLFLGGSATVAFPSGIGIEAMGVAFYGGLSNRTIPAIKLNKDERVDEINLYALNGGGIDIGQDDITVQCAIGRLQVWNVGPTQTAVRVRGYHTEIDLINFKQTISGGIACDMTDASDIVIKEIYCIGGAAPGIVLNNSNNVYLPHLRGDTVTGSSSTSALLSIDGCTNIQFGVQAFVITSGTLNYLVRIGQNTTDVSKGIKGTIQAQRTGGCIVQAGYATELWLDINVANTDRYAFGQPSTKAVEYTTGLSGPIAIEAWLPSSGVTVSSGTQVGELTVHQGTTTTFNGNVTVTGTLSGVGSGSPATARVSAAPYTPDYLGPTTVIENFASGNGWANDAASTGTWTATQATASASHGYTVGRMVTDAVGGTAIANVTGKPAVDLSSKYKQILWWVYNFVSPQAYAVYELRASHAGGLAAGHYLRWDLANTAIATGQSLVQISTMTPIPLSSGDAAMTGTVDKQAITEWEIRVAGRASGGPAPAQALTVYYGGLDLNTNGLPQFGSNGQAIFTFDDSFDGGYTYARPELISRGWRGTMFPIIGQFGTGSTTTACMTQTQYLILTRNYGFEAGVHSNTLTMHQAYGAGTDTLADAQADYDAARQWNSDNGLPGDVMAYPNGVHGVTTGNPATPYSMGLRKWFRGARTVSYQYPGAILNPTPLTNRMLVRAITIGSTTAPTVAQLCATGGYLERAAAANAMIVFTIHQIGTSATSSGGAGGAPYLNLTDFQTLLNKVQSLGMAVPTFGQALNAAQASL